MKRIGTIVVASAALLAAGLTSASAAPGEYDGAGGPIIHPYGFAYGVDQGRYAGLQTGRSVGHDRARFDTGFGTACDTSRVESSFCHDEY